MFCPGCGIGEERSVPFCRTCGTDLRAVRISLEQPDIVMVKADTSRIEIGRAIADKIRDADRVQDLEDILPKIEKFLETPQERKLRRLRVGVITAMAGAGATVAFLLLSLLAADTFFLSSLGVIVFLIGVGIVANGLLFTVPGSTIKTALRSRDESEKLAEGSEKGFLNALPAFGVQRSSAGQSVTENTTRHLGGEIRNTAPEIESLKEANRP
jgi:hypothetical protein